MSRRWRLLGAVGLVVVGACGTDGRTLAPPGPDQTLPPSTAAQPEIESQAGSTRPPQVAGEGGMLLSSPAFIPGGPIPHAHSCYGENTPPPLSWQGVPEGTEELAISLVEERPDGRSVHWVVAGLDPAVAGLAGGTLPDGAVESTNDFAEVGWFGPCPDTDGVAELVFRLYALPTPSGLGPGAGGAASLEAIEASATDVAQLTVTFERPQQG